MEQIMDQSQALLFLQEIQLEQLRLIQQMIASMKEMKQLLFLSQVFLVQMLQKADLSLSL